MLWKNDFDSAEVVKMFIEHLFDTVNTRPFVFTLCVVDKTVYVPLAQKHNGAILDKAVEEFYKPA